jgi:phosphatidate phosphatase PAH1
MGSSQSSSSASPSSSFRSTKEEESSDIGGGDDNNNNNNNNNNNTNNGIPVVLRITDDDVMKGEKKTKRKKKKVNSASSVEYQCRKQKRVWSKCVRDHYETKFLPGKSLDPVEDNDCDDYFDNFRECYMKSMLQKTQKKPAEGSMLHEYMIEEGIPTDNVAKTTTTNDGGR